MFSCKNLIVIVVAFYLIFKVLKDNVQKVGVGLLAFYLLNVNCIGKLLILLIINTVKRTI